MNNYAEKTQKTKGHAASNNVARSRFRNADAFQFVDNRQSAIAQRKLQEMAMNSHQVKQSKTLKDMANNSDNVQKFSTIPGQQELVQHKDGQTEASIQTPVIQRKMTFSGPKKEIASGKQTLNEAYQVGLPEGQKAGLDFEGIGEDAYKNPKFNTVEKDRPEQDGLGSQLIGKIIEEGDVNIYLGEFRNDARPTDAEKSEKGESSGSEVLLESGATAIQLIHELIHAYHFAFDPWNAKEKSDTVPINVGGNIEDTSAEEASTVGLGQWSDFGLTENAFRSKMGLEKKIKY